ncbi:hypothetical protein LR68_02069 [Anoxybacillus sp. BCO1]|nr:hypothetical protein LR68_02069 [Anoxybacillus sp. BCO1]
MYFFVNYSKMKVDFLKGVWVIMEMIETKSLQQWIYRLIALHDEFMKLGDIAQANKTKQLN